MKFAMRSLGVALVAVSSAKSWCQTAPPLPVFEGFTVESSCQPHDDGFHFRYTYFVTNPPTNTDEIWHLHLPAGVACPVIDFVPAPGWFGFVEDLTNAAFTLPQHPQVALWHPRAGHGVPGSRSGPFTFASCAPPTIGELWIGIWLTPYFEAYMDAFGLEGLEAEFEDSVRRAYIRKVPTLAPSSEDLGSFAHWDELYANVSKAKELGWITAALAEAVQVRLREGRQAAVMQDLATASGKLSEVVSLVQQADESQRKVEARDLVVLNAQYLKEHLPWPCEPALVLAPVSAHHGIGERHTATARLYNRATGLPMVGEQVIIAVEDGPHAGTRAQGVTDGEGKFSLQYTGVKVGEDRLRAYTPGEGESLSKLVVVVGKENDSLPPKVQRPRSKRPRASLSGPASECRVSRGELGGAFSEVATVEWSAGPDLVVASFTPRMLMSAPGAEFYLNETTSNMGAAAAPPSVTRYYISQEYPVNPATAVVLGERQIPPLAPGEESQRPQVVLRVPSTLPAGTYFLDACADAPNSIVETNEANNCASSSLQVVAGFLPPNAPPICAQATAIPGLLWPPNHRFVEVGIAGVSDADGDAVTLTVTGVTQDEPTEGLGDGDGCPDAEVGEGGKVRLRAERSGTGNGRVYVVSFTGSDGKGGRCTGSVRVGVPHDQNQPPVDDGQSHDATACSGRNPRR